VTNNSYATTQVAIEDLKVPTLDKARVEELTRPEIEMALRELGGLNGGAPPGLHIEFRGHRFWSAVVWGGSDTRWYDCLEDALVAECDRVLKNIAEEPAETAFGLRGRTDVQR
jgi:hypothetical protein